MIMTMYGGELKTFYFALFKKKSLVFLIFLVYLVPTLVHMREQPIYNCLYPKLVVSEIANPNI